MSLPFPLVQLVDRLRKPVRLIFMGTRDTTKAREAAVAHFAKRRARAAVDELQAQQVISREEADDLRSRIH